MKTLNRIMLATLPLLAGHALAEDVVVPVIPTETTAATQAQTQLRRGAELMTDAERTAQRDRMRSATSTEERSALRTEQHTQMQQRATERGVSIPDTPAAGGQGMGNPYGQGRSQGASSGGQGQGRGGNMGGMGGGQRQGGGQGMGGGQGRGGRGR